MKKEIQLDQLLKTLPEEFRNKSEYDLIYHISEIGQDYDISFEELDKIFSETYNIITGISRIDTLPDNLNIILNPENKINFEKIAKELKQLIEKLMTALGNKFPLKISEMPPEIIETREKKRPSDGEKKYDSDTNTKIIKSVLESEKRSDTKELEIRPEMHPEEIYPDIKKVEEKLPQKPVSIIEHKMSNITSLPKKESEHTSIPIQKKKYDVDPYREVI